MLFTYAKSNTIISISLLSFDINYIANTLTKALKKISDSVHPVLPSVLACSYLGPVITLSKPLSVWLWVFLIAWVYSWFPEIL